MERAESADSSNFRGLIFRFAIAFPPPSAYKHEPIIPLAFLACLLGDAGWSSPVARQAHNLKVVGSNPTPATNFFLYISMV